MMIKIIYYVCMYAMEADDAAKNNSGKISLSYFSRHKFCVVWKVLIFIRVGGWNERLMYANLADLIWIFRF